MHNKVDLAALAALALFGLKKENEDGFRWTWDVRIMLQMQQWIKNQRANEKGQIMCHELSCRLTNHHL